MNLKVLSQVTVAVIWLFTLQPANASDCAILEPWYTQGHPASKPEATNTERVQQSQREYTLRTQAAIALDEAYRARRLDRTVLATCLAPLDDRQNFLETFYYTLFKNSLSKLGKAQSPTLQAFMRLFEHKYGNGTPIFRITGTFEETSDTPLGAGFHRASGSIYMDFARIHPDDWLIIFIHETLHALDDQIWVGVEGYSQADQAKHFVELSQTYKKYGDLPETERAAMQTWITAGLDRGLLAEYRAWAATFQIYREGLIEGLWSKRSWMEKVLAGQKDRESTPEFTYRYLDAHSEDPSTGIFSIALIKSALNQVRVEYRQSATPPSLCGFSQLDLR